MGNHGAAGVWRIPAAVLLAGVLQAGWPVGPVFQHLGTEDGLPDNRVTAIVRDRAGYVWIGTQGGLVRHEAHRLQVLRHDPEDPDSLPGNNVLSAMAHSGGNVWAAISGQGLVELQGDRVRRHLRLAVDGGELRQDLIWSMAEDCDGRIWLAFARGDLARLDPETGWLEHLESGQIGLPGSGFQLQVHVDRQCRLWTLRIDGAWRSGNLEQPRFRQVVDPADHGLDNLLTMHESADGRIFLGGRAGMLVSDGDGFRLVRVLDLGPTTIAEAGDGQLWVGMPDSLVRLDENKGVVDRLYSLPQVPDGIPEGQIAALHRGAEGELWAGIDGGGVAVLPPGWRGFRRFQAGPEHSDFHLGQVTAVVADPDSDRLWLGSVDHGIQWLDLAGGAGEAVALHEDRPGPERLVVDLVLAGTELLVLQRDQLLAVGRQSGHVRTVDLESDIPGPALQMLAPAGKGEFWLGTLDQGLFRIDADGRVVVRYHAGGEGPFHLEEAEPRQIIPGPDGRWLLLGHRSVYFQDGRGRFRTLESTVDLKPRHMARVGDTLWLARDSLLETWRQTGPDSWEATGSYSARDGLPAGEVAGIHPDTDGRIWLTMSTGLARLEPESGRFRLFSRTAGLPVSEFLPGAGLRLPDGRLVAGTTRGLVVVDPQAITAPARPPPVHITGIRAGDHWLAPPDSGGIDLPHDRSALEFRFVALSYLDPDRNRYRLRLEGWEDDWFHQTGQTGRFYSRLPPGNYRFRVQAANPEGTWNETGDTLAVRIRPPPWNGPGAWFAYAVLAVSAGALGWRGLGRSRRRRQELRRVREQRALAEEQQRFLAELAASLDPMDLGRVVAGELRRVTGADSCWLGYLQEDFPRGLLVSGKGSGIVDREAWRDRLKAGNTGAQMTVEIIHEGRQLAAAVLECSAATFGPGARARADLVLQTAGQAMENARLMQSVRTLAQQAEQASTAKSGFLATMSHEIRTPLHGLLGMVELLEGTALEPDQREMLGTINLSGRQLQRILNDVLDLSRIEAGRIELVERPFELVALLEQVVDLHAPVAARKGLDMRLRLAANVPVLAHGDADRLAQVLGNLLNNAVKFTDHGGVELTCDPDRNRLVFAVSDSGPGIDPVARDALFKPFTQLDATTTRQHSGTGLGLAICRRLTEAMSGTLSVADRTGTGSRFRLALPMNTRPADIPRRSRILDGFILGTVLAPPTDRVALRLARRWGLKRVRLCAGAGLPDAEAILTDGRRPLPEAVATGDVPVLYLALPGMVSGPLPENARILRWPLTESRLIAAAMDLRLRRLLRGSGG